MMNPTYHFARMRELLEEYEPSRERSLATTKLDECEMWLAKCTPTQEALARDQAAAGGSSAGWSPGSGGGGGYGGNASASGSGSTAVGGAGGGGYVPPRPGG